MYKKNLRCGANRACTWETYTSRDDQIITVGVVMPKFFFLFHTLLSQCKLIGNSLFGPQCMTWACNYMVWPLRNWLQRLVLWGLAGAFLCFQSFTSLLPYPSLCSSNAHLLSAPLSRHWTMGDRAFSVAGPTLWNVLPLGLRQCTSAAFFESQQKPHLFRLTFPEAF